ncbi:MAG: hypothetical protein HND48_15595 [Chloroflexi bacterium]|nr:hypothetical protein [Chloroflexota bacterium]
MLDEPALAERCRNAFDAGSRKLDSLLWNGEYFVQRIDDVDAYKYQHGLGCLTDQLLGQLHAHALGLGDLLPADHIRTAIKSVFDYNFRAGFENHTNCQRTYVLNDESGLLLCTWPKGGRPKYPFVYSDEVWTGIEYHVAAELRSTTAGSTPVCSSSRPCRIAMTESGATGGTRSNAAIITPVRCRVGRFCSPSAASTATSATVSFRSIRSQTPAPIQIVSSVLV